MSGAAANAPVGLAQCEDFLQFESALRQSRDIDDKIIQALNNSIPTASFRADVSEQCKNLWTNIDSIHTKRESAIQRCVAFSEERVKSLVASGEERNVVRQAQVTFRMLKSELYVESVVRDRTLKAFNEKCRDHFKPPAATS